MSLRLASARVISSVSTAVLRNVFRRPAANFPGKVALYVDPHLIRDMAANLSEGSVVVCGTNGKTTVTNLLADVLEKAEKKVICNRIGSNLDSGIATSMLQGGHADWGVFECDEMWLGKVLPGLQSRYLLLLNLFNDQLDRVGEMRNVQDSIVAAIKRSPDTVLVYNGDDPMCDYIAASVPNASIRFGIGEDMGLRPQKEADPQKCQMCSEELVYEYSQYDQLGAFACSECGFARQPLDFVAKEVSITGSGIVFEVSYKGETKKITSSFLGAYMVYNLLATYSAARLTGCSFENFQQALDAFDPQNGRLQRFEIEGRSILLNLAKNPTGFNQNLWLIMQDTGPKVVAFYVNDKEGDGRDISWIEDVEFEDLAEANQSDIMVYAGGIRREDLQERLKKANLDADLVEGASDILEKVSSLPAEQSLYVIANYTALPALHADLTAVSKGQTL